MDFKELSNCDLVKLCAEKTNNALAWNEFHHRFDDRIRAMVMRYCSLKHLPGWELIDDLTNDTYLRLVKDGCKALREFRCDHENAFYTFLVFAARTAVDLYHKNRSALRRRHQKRSLDDEASQEESGLRLIDILANPYAPAPDEKLMLESLRQEVEMILEEVIGGHEKGRDKKIFLLHVYDDLTAQEISEQVSLSTQRIRNIITDIKKRLKTKRESKA